MLPYHLRLPRIFPDEALPQLLQRRQYETIVAALAGLAQTADAGIRIDLYKKPIAARRGLDRVHA
jgi:hypothetical protein